MTEGIIILTDGERVEKALYVNSDAYFSWLGVRLLEKFKDETLEKYISNYSNVKYNKYNREVRELYRANYDYTDEDREKMLKLTNKIELRTYTIKGANKFKYYNFLKQLSYVPSHIYTYNKDKNMLLIKGYDGEYEVTKENVNIYR